MRLIALLLAGLCLTLPNRGAAQAPPAVPLSPTVRIQSFSVIVPHYDDALRWYTERLGFVVVMDQSIPGGGRFLMVAPPGQGDFGIVLQEPVTASSSDDPMPDYSNRVGTVVNVVLRVSDLAAYAAQLQKRGVSFVMGPRDMPWGSQATFRDLYGNTFVLVQPRTSGNR